MPTRVRFRINKITGEVEEFLVDDQDRTLPEAEHDRVAGEVGRVIARHPTLHEVPAAPPGEESGRTPGGETESEAEREGNDETPVRRGNS